MPTEKFYDSAKAVEGAPDVEEHQFAVRWGATQPVDRPVEVAGVPLDRSGINRLIRTLRRARNSAYEADE